jgi:ryanodine receptor 2
MKYEPHPVDTSGVVLPPEVVQLVETLARNTHEVWASRKVSEGWTYSPVTDAAEKTHSCLVPYDRLPERMKDYDRATAMNALKLAVKLGFSIVKREPEERQ